MNEQKTKLVRLQKFISDAGLSSRRKAEKFILDGLVEVNGEKTTILGTKIDPVNDVVSVEGVVINTDLVEKIYVLFHKPRGCVTTLSDPENRPTVMDYLTQIRERIYPVGRLDYYSEGLLLLTNDGEVANRVMHPRHEVTKIYEVKVFGAITEDILKKLKKGIFVDGTLLKASLVRVIKILPQKTWLEFRLKEGKNREIRKLCEAVGITIDKLKRIAIADLTIDGIAPGKHKIISKKELYFKLGWHLLEKNSLNKNSLNNEKMLFRSKKKTVRLKSRASKYSKAKRADDQSFIKYRPHHYALTVKNIKTKKEQSEAQKKSNDEHNDQKPKGKK